VIFLASEVGDKLTVGNTKEGFPVNLGSLIELVLKIRKISPDTRI
jgi:hypothetical protein